MTDVSTSERSTRGHRNRSARIALATALALVLVPLATAQADWESDFHETNTYWGLQVNIAVPDFGSKIGENSSRPYLAVSDVTDVAGGLRLFFGYRVHPYAAIGMSLDWTGGVDFDSTAGKQDVDIFTGSINIKGYPLAKWLDTVAEGRIQPYFHLSPGFIGLNNSDIKTPLHLKFGIGGGVDYWVNESWTVHTDVEHVWSFGTLNGLDFTTIGIGGAYHF